MEAPGPLLRRLDELEIQREGIDQRLISLEDEKRRAKALAAVKESDVSRMLDALADDMAALDRDHLKDFIGTLIEEVILDPATRAGSIRYRIAQRSGVMLASPRGSSLIPTLHASMPFQAPKNRKEGCPRTRCAQ